MNPKGEEFSEQNANLEHGNEQESNQTNSVQENNEYLTSPQTENTNTQQNPGQNVNMSYQTMEAYQTNNYHDFYSNYSQGISNIQQENTYQTNQFYPGMQNQIIEKTWTKHPRDRAPGQKGTELFVGNLSLDTFEADLNDIFRDCGEIADIRLHKNAQTKKCYAFIRFADKEALKNAMEKNLTTLKGRKIKVTKSNENSTIFIGNIRKNWTNSEFHNCEKVEHFADSNLANKNRGFCFVVFKNRNEAIKALNYVTSKGGINIDGVPLTCDWADVVDEDDNNSKQIFIAGLQDDVEESHLREIFSRYGNIVEVLMSKMHKNSKRKDLAFITFNTHEEAKKAAEMYKVEYPRESNSESESEKRNILGESVNVSLAFSQQAMQAKKKVKDSRRKVYPYQQNPTPYHGNTSHHSTHKPHYNPNPTNSYSNLPQMTNTVPSQTIPGVNNPNLNANAMMAMMNVINMNKKNMNINPQLMSQMMNACLESMVNQNTSGNLNQPFNQNPNLSKSQYTPSVMNPLVTQQLNTTGNLTSPNFINPSLNNNLLSPTIPQSLNTQISNSPSAYGNFNYLNYGLNNLNASTYPLTSLNQPKIMSLDPNFNTKHLKKINKTKRSLTILNPSTSNWRSDA